MNSSALSTPFLHLKTSSSPLPHFIPPISIPTLSRKTTARPSSSLRNNATHSPPLIHTLKSLASTAIFVGAAAFIASNFSALPAIAQTSVAVEEERAEEDQSFKNLIDTNPEAIDSLKSLLQEKLENGEDLEALKILKQLVSSQPSVMDFKFLMARLLSEMGEVEDARKVFEEILAANPLSFEALFENALLMDRCGEGEAVIRRLEEALEIAKEGNKVKEARDVRLIMAQIQFLQKNVEEALRSYDKLSKEDPSDFRPYFCRGMIYSLLDRNEEANEQFGKYRELSPTKFEVEGFLRTPLSKIKMFGSHDDN